MLNRLHMKTFVYLCDFIRRGSKIFTLADAKDLKKVFN